MYHMSISHCNLEAVKLQNMSGIIAIDFHIYYLDQFKIINSFIITEISNFGFCLCKNFSFN